MYVAWITNEVCSNSFLYCVFSDEEATNTVTNFLHGILEGKAPPDPSRNIAFQCEESPSEIEVIA